MLVIIQWTFAESAKQYLYTIHVRTRAHRFREGPIFAVDLSLLPGVILYTGFYSRLTITPGMHLQHFSSNRAGGLIRTEL
jgi:hypothetical protein